MSDAKVSSKLPTFPSQHTPPNDSKTADKGNGPLVSARSRADAVTGGIKATRLIDESSTTSTSTQPRVVTSVPKLKNHSPAYGATQPKAAPSSSSASSSALSTPPARTGPERLDFSKPETIGMVERQAPRGDIHVLAGMIEQGAAKYVSADCRNILMARMVFDRSLKRDERRSLVETLLDAGAHAGGAYDGTPHITGAAFQGNLDLVLLLAQRGADINAKDYKGNTALMNFAQHSDDDEGQLCIISLQRLELNANIVNGRGQNALLMAAEKGNAKCMQTLTRLESKLGQKDNKHQGLLISAVCSNKIDAVRVALEANVKVDQRDKNNETALFHAISNRAPDIVSLLIESGADVNKRNHKGETPLFIACKVGCPDKIIEALLNAGAKPDILDRKGRSPISMANAQDSGRYKALFDKFEGKSSDAAGRARNAEAGRQPENQDRKTLFDAIASSNFQRVFDALQYGDLVINEPDREGITPLMHACKTKCSDEIIKLLLRFGADPEQKNRKGQSAIDFVPEARRTEFEHFFTQQYINSL